MSVQHSALSKRLGQLSESLGKKASISQQIAKVLTDLIITGKLNPGERIVESRVAKQLGVGQPTVREALVALEHQGLVVRRSNQGCVVTTLTRQEVADVLRIRGELEVLAVELATEKATDENVRKLLAITDQMKHAARKRDVEQFFARDFEFHKLLWESSGNSYLPKLLAQVLLPLLAFLFIRNMRNNAHIDLIESAEAHVDLAKAILIRNPRKSRAIAVEKFEMFANQHENLYEDEAGTAREVPAARLSRLRQ
jgi:DNA-binding GntR family transcriptional regulator